MLLTIFCGKCRKIKKQHLLEIKMVCNIMNVFTVSFDQFEASLHCRIGLLLKNKK